MERCVIVGDTPVHIMQSYTNTLLGIRMSLVEYTTVIVAGYDRYYSTLVRQTLQYSFGHPKHHNVCTAYKVTKSSHALYTW